jgi:ribonuclease HII
MNLQLYNPNEIICGCDEAGRGALAGPVVASAVILPNNFFHAQLNDSKKISHKIRLELAEFIKTESLYWGIGIVDTPKIDKINILQSSIKAMHIAIKKIIIKMKKKPKLLIIDGNKFKAYENIQHECIIKGDSKYASIAAASVIAKTHRDYLMDTLHREYPKYNWTKNKGYPTKEHKQKIINHGITKYHRKSFKLFETQHKLQF